MSPTDVKAMLSVTILSLLRSANILTKVQSLYKCSFFNDFLIVSFIERSNLLCVLSTELKLLLENVLFLNVF
jgi:hypothetical protein